MKNELKRRRILKALQAECAALSGLTQKLEAEMQNKHGVKAA